MRERVELATTFGVRLKSEICGDPAFVRAACEGSLKRLDVDHIDLYYIQRIDTQVPIEVTICLHFSFFPLFVVEACILFFVLFLCALKDG